MSQKLNNAPPILKLLAQKIRYHRKNRGLTQVQLSMDSGVEHRHLQKIEAGTVDLRLGTISKIAKSLNVPACYLLEDFVSVEGCEQGMARPVDVMTGVNIPVMALGVDLQVKFANNAFLGLAGYAREEIVAGLPFQSLVSNDEERQAMSGLRDAVMQSKPEPTSFYTQLKTKSGEIVRRLVHWNYIYGPDKSVVGFLLMYMNPNDQNIADNAFGIIPSQQH